MYGCVYICHQNNSAFVMYGDNDIYKYLQSIHRERTGVRENEGGQRERTYIKKICCVTLCVVLPSEINKETTWKVNWFMQLLSTTGNKMNVSFSFWTFCLKKHTVF